MLIHIFVRAEATGEAECQHHGECEREHEVLILHFRVTTEGGGVGESKVSNCMLFEMEDAAERAVIEAWDSTDDTVFWTLDDDMVREEAVRLAAKADYLDHDEAVWWSMSEITGESV